MGNIFDKIEELLLKEERYKTEDNKILKTKVYEDTILMNENLLNLLLNDDKIKKEFFVQIKDTLVFDKQKFIWLLESKEFLPDSYTRYTNKIGLVFNNDFISKKHDVVLDFPYKDAYLVGGQDKEDQKRNEIFYHEIIASDHISRMLEPKVFANAKRFIKDGIEENITFKDDDNLIIKGNNLIALSSLLKRYEGKVKLIYIDPPFNTGTDTFKYNDNFTRSAWLIFMKNRLELAKNLLTDDGSIFVQIDHNQGHYLKVLMDEIFGEENFMNEIVWRYRTYIGQVKDYFPKKHDVIFWYIKDKRPDFTVQNVGNFEDTPDFNRWNKYLNENGEIIYPNYPKTDSRFMAYLNKYKKQYGLPKDGDIIYKNKGYVVDDVWEDIIALDAKNETERLKEFSGSGQKPEALIQRIIKAVTKEKEIVLDFFLGSGTTASVAHKMKRQYIGIEQMEYVQEISVKRFKDVIKGEQGGVSFSEKWQGGGSFVYTELLENSNELIKEIEETTNQNILNIKAKIFNDNRIVPYITKKEIEKLENEFNELSLEEQKKVLTLIVDKNKLYVNYSDIDDESYNIKEEDKNFTHSFYKGDNR